MIHVQIIPAANVGLLWYEILRPEGPRPKRDANRQVRMYGMVYFAFSWHTKKIMIQEDTGIQYLKRFNYKSYKRCQTIKQSDLADQTVQSKV